MRIPHQRGLEGLPENHPHGLTGPKSTWGKSTYEFRKQRGPGDPCQARARVCRLQGSREPNPTPGHTAHQEPFSLVLGIPCGWSASQKDARASPPGGAAGRAEDRRTPRCRSLGCGVQSHPDVPGAKTNLPLAFGPPSSSAKGEPPGPTGELAGKHLTGSLPSAALAARGPGSFHPHSQPSQGAAQGQDGPRASRGPGVLVLAQGDHLGAPPQAGAPAVSTNRSLAPQKPRS